MADAPLYWLGSYDEGDQLYRLKGNRPLRLSVVAAIGIVALAASVATPAAALAQATAALVPVPDPAYADVEALAASNLIETLATGEAPHSRAAFARWASEASERAAVRGADALTPRVQAALARLRRRFAPSTDQPEPSLVLRDAVADLHFAQSPYRPLGPGAASGIDGLLNPLLQRNQGRKVADGWTVAAELAAEAQSGRFAASIRPRAWLLSPRGPRFAPTDADPADASLSATLHSAYARFLIGPIGLEAGRNPVTVGHGRDGGPLLSNNARGLDMVRLATERPVRLPGPFRGWGQWRASALLAQMGSNRDVPRSWLSAFRLSNRPWAYTELALVYVNLQGGEGAPAGSFRERTVDVLFPFLGGVIPLSDKAGGGDFHVTVPSIRTHFFGNFIATDLRANGEQARRAFWQDVIWAFGARTYGLGSEGRLDLWADAKSAGPLPHTHHQYTSGLTLDGRVLGDPLGPNARGVSAGAAWTATDWKVEASVAQERYSADEWKLEGAFEGDTRPWVWTKTIERTSEIRRRLTLDWTRTPQRAGVAVAVRLAYERVANFAFTGERRHNFAVRLRARWSGH